MKMLTNFDYNGNVISQRADGFVNLTQMCNANGKKLENFMKATKTKEYVIALSNSVQMDVVETKEGQNGGTWGHPSLAINLARWISADFAVWCDAHIFNLMATGQTSLDIDPLAEMRLKIEYERLKGQNLNTEYALTTFRHTIVTTCPEPVQQKILGYSEVKVVEYRDRVLKDEEIIRDGSTLNKTQLCNRYGFITKNGKPDYQKLNKTLNSLNIPADAWETKVSLLNNVEFKTEYLDQLDEVLLTSTRQLYLGE